MKDLVIPATEVTPFVNFNIQKGDFEIMGESRPENSASFFEPIFSWIEDFIIACESNHSILSKINIRLHFTYFNSTSAKCLLTILGKFERIHTFGIGVKVDWYYEQQDIDMRNSGEEFSKVIHMPFSFIPVP